MTDEMKALAFLKQAFRLSWNDNSLQRAPEYDVLKGGTVFFFRDGKGKVYEPFPDRDCIKSYTEEYLNEALVLAKYSDKVLWNDDLKRFFARESFCELKKMNLSVVKKSKIIAKTIEALGYDKKWIREMFISRLNEALSEN